MVLLRVGQVQAEAPIAPGVELNLQILDLERPKEGTVVRFANGKSLTEPAPDRSLPGPTSLLQHLGSLTKTHRLEFEGEVVGVSPDKCTLRLDVYFPEGLVRGPQRDRTSPALAQLFLHLVPLAEEQEEEDEKARPSSSFSLAKSCFEALKAEAGEVLPPDASNPELFSLRSCIMALPGTPQAPPLPPPALGPSLLTPSLLILPEAPLCRILSFLDADSLQQVAKTCRLLRAMASDTAPGLRLALFPHQRMAIRWMLGREAAPRPVPHPTLRKFPVEGGGELWGDTATGAMQVTTPLPLHDFRGGLFCDEPGLGKTITSLGLMLRTARKLPAAPAGARVIWADGPARRLGFYSIAPGAAGAQQAQQVKHGCGELRRSRRGRRELPEHCGVDPTPAMMDEAWMDATAAAAAAEAMAAAMAPVPKRRKMARAGSGKPGTPFPPPAANATTNKTTAPSSGEEDGTPPLPPLVTPIPQERTKKRKFLVCTDSDGDGCDPGPSTYARPVRAAAAAAAAILAAGDGGGSGGGDSRPTRIALGGGGDALQGASSTPTSHSSGGSENMVGSPVSSVSGSGPSSGSSWGPGRFSESSDDADDDAGYAAAVDSAGGSDGAVAAVGGGGSVGGYGGGEVAMEDHSSWLQCEVCFKWRRVTVEAVTAAAASGGVWSCYQHPNEGWRSCSIRGDLPEKDEDITHAEGWVGPGEEPGSRENVDFFRKLMTKHNQLQYLAAGRYVRKPAAWLKVLIDQDPEALAKGSGFTLQGEAAFQWEGFGNFLRDVGFCPINVGKKGVKDKGNARPAHWTSLPHTRNDWRHWEQPDLLRLLRFDRVALCGALAAFFADGPLPQLQRVFLSPATLVVVPKELVQHWKDQLAWHTRPGALRVAVFEDCKSNDILPHVLAWEYDIVIATFSRMSVEWEAAKQGVSPLAQIHWLRVILDEGHTVGSFNITNKLEMLKNLRAERRWVMTGTPSPSQSASGGEITLKHAQPLLAVLHDQALGSSQRAFSDAIERQLKDCPLAPRWRLLAALRRCLIRASKAELWSLPRLSKRVKLLEFEPSHAESYNHFVELVRNNLLTSDWYDPDHKESLMAPNNGKRASALLINLGKSCNVAGNIVLQVAGKDLHETLQLVAGANAMVEPGPLSFGGPFCPAGHPLAAAEDAFLRGGCCAREGCGKRVRVVLLTPCACLVCVDCAARDRHACPVCRRGYTMQSKHDPARKEDNPHPKWAVPQELIEWQPAYAQLGAQGEEEGTWQVNWEETSTDSSKVKYLLQRLRTLGALPPPGWVPNAWGAAAGSLAAVWPPTEGGPPTKAIVFTLSWEHGKLLKHALKKAAPDLCTALYIHEKQDVKAKELMRFRHDPRCGVLLMDESGALGLDLSFVQHVFLMEPIPNKSLEEQVVSRAHRMGAKSEVFVEVLAMRGTVEEEMVRRNGDLGGRAKEESGAAAAAAELKKEAVKEEEVGGSSSGDCGVREAEAELRRQDRQEAVKRMDRNAYLLSLRPVASAEERGKSIRC